MKQHVFVFAYDYRGRHYQGSQLIMMLKLIFKKCIFEHCRSLYCIKLFTAVSYEFA